MKISFPKAMAVILIFARNFFAARVNFFGNVYVLALSWSAKYISHENFPPPFSAGESFFYGAKPFTERRLDTATAPVRNY
jgi:hypothetical protein